MSYIIHNLSNTSEYKAWQTMLARCLNPRHKAYHNYGGRGIKVCARWLNDMRTFISDMGPKPTPAHELDRRDNNADYCPENCRWVTRSENSRNRRSNRFVEYDGERMTLVEASQRFNIAPDTLRRRLEAGRSVAEALTSEVRKKAANGDGKRPQFENKSGVWGVCLRRGKYVGSVQKCGVRRFTRAYATAEEARAAREILKQKLHDSIEK